MHKYKFIECVFVFVLKKKWKGSVKVSLENYVCVSDTKGGLFCFSLSQIESKISLGGNLRFIEGLF